jgi:hypothetical protein
MNKALIKYQYFGILSFIFLLFSCSSLTTLTVKMLEPGTINLSKDINTLALINRALPATNKLNAVEDVLSGESYNQNLQGRQHILEGLNKALTESPRYRSFLTNVQYIGNGTGTSFPPPIGWDTISKICSDNHTDAVIAMETFHSDCSITHEDSESQLTNEFGVSLPVTQYYVTQKVTIKVGFRIYDPNNKTIEDQYAYTYSKVWNSEGTNLGEAILALTKKQQSVNQACYAAGGVYETRISPSFQNDQRSIYIQKGKKPMAVGGRLAITGNWDEAAFNWNRVLITSKNQKLCSKACYNLALAAEIKGDLDSAKVWLSKSLAQYNNKQTINYQNIINKKYSDMIKLNQPINPDSLMRK